MPLFARSKNRPLRRAVLFWLLIALSGGCVSAAPVNLPDYRGARHAAPDRFTICHGYGCLEKSKVRLSASEWRDIQSLFPPASDAAAERQQIAAAIARMEQLTGVKIGTEKDEGGAAIFGHDPYQMDCIDEAVNTSLYLSLLQHKELLTWHVAAEPLRRGYFIDAAWPHNTAAIRDKKTGQVYAVDSWFGKNGQKPFIIEAETWQKGARP